MDMEVLPLFALLFVVNHSFLHHFFYKNGGNSNLWIIGIHIKKVSMAGEEYRIIGVIAIESFVYIFVFFPFIPYYIDQTNILYHYTKAILPYNFHYTLRNFYFRRVFVVSLMSVNTVSMFALLVFVEVEPNTSDIFPGFYV